MLVSMLETGEWSIEGSEAGHQGRSIGYGHRHVGRRRCPTPCDCHGQRSDGQSRQAEGASRRNGTGGAGTSGRDWQRRRPRARGTGSDRAKQCRKNLALRFEPSSTSARKSSERRHGRIQSPATDVAGQTAVRNPAEENAGNRGGSHQPAAAPCTSRWTGASRCSA